MALYYESTRLYFERSGCGGGRLRFLPEHPQLQTAWVRREPTIRIPFERAWSLALDRHRFGVNYTPSKNWWFCWNEWDADPIRRDLDAIAALGADHLRILLIWPYFQPNPKWVSPLHLERLDQLLTLMGERKLDAVVTALTGQLSGWFFLPPFNKAGTAFYADEAMWKAQEIFVRQLAGVMKSKNNIIGFDFGNEINTCWSTEPAVGDAWMAKMFALMESVSPDHVHVNGVDELPWFEIDHVFSAGAGGAADADDALLSILVRGAEVWRADGSSEHEAAGGECNSDSRLCGRCSKAGVGGGVQYLHRIAE